MTRTLLSANQTSSGQLQLSYLQLKQRQSAIQMQVRQSHQAVDKQESPVASPPDCSDADLFQILTSVLVGMARGEQIVQCIREVLVQDDTFTPMNLYRYLGKDSRQINTQNILDFLEDNHSLGNEKQTVYILTRVFVKYGITNLANIQYTQFLNFVYPFNTGVLREIGVNRIKNYPQLDKHLKNSKPLEGVIIGFLSLIQQEIEMQRKVQLQLLDQRFPSRDKLRKVLKSIKKASQKMCKTVIENSQNSISMLELRNFIKAFMDVPQHLFLYLSRRLGMNKSGLIPLSNIEQALKKPKKHQCPGLLASEENGCLEGQQMTRFASSECKEFKEQAYREQLYKQLAHTLKIPNIRLSSTPRNKAIAPADRYQKTYGPPNRKSQSRNKTPCRKNKHARPIEDYLIGRERQLIPNQQKLNQTDAYLNQTNAYLDPTNANSNQTDAFWNHPNTHLNDIHYDNLPGREADRHHEIKVQTIQLPEQKPSNENKLQYSKINHTFKKYVQYFLNGHKQIQQCRIKINNLKVDYLSLFKSLDDGRGAIEAEDLRKLYVMLSGIPTEYDFQLIVDRFAQPDEKWLSYSEFADIFRSNSCSNPEKSLESLRNASSKPPSQIEQLQPEVIRTLSQILYLNLDLEHNLHRIIAQLQHSELQRLFQRINSNSESKGFINYQQLKKYLTDDLQMSVSMMDLMALLKRFDKSKNGVVLKEEFLLI